MKELAVWLQHWLGLMEYYGQHISFSLILSYNPPPA